MFVWDLSPWPLRQLSHLVPGHGVRVRYLLGTNVNTPFNFSSTYARIPARWRCPSTRSRSYTRDRAQKWAPSSCVHTTFVSSGQSTALFSLLNSCFKMAPDRAKWTQSVNTTPFCACTLALVPEHQVYMWTAPEIQVKGNQRFFSSSRLRFSFLPLRLAPSLSGWVNV